MKVEYPKWLYHPTEAPRLVHDPDEQAALGELWVESPADVKAAVSSEDAVAQAEGPKPVRGGKRR